MCGDMFVCMQRYCKRAGVGGECVRGECVGGECGCNCLLSTR